MRLLGSVFSFFELLSFAFDFKLLKHFNFVNNKPLAVIKRRIHPKKS